MIYANYNSEELEEHFSNYLIERLSYSKITTFSRNEKAFEMSYIYHEPFKKSSSSIAGSAYHKSLSYFFEELRDGNEIDIVGLQEEAYAYIQNVDADDWKLQKTTPTIDSCIQKATKSVNALTENFLSYKQLYLKDLGEILYIEKVIESWLTINGVDIPLPIIGVLDLVIKLNDGRIIIIDHKSKTSFSDEKDIKFSGGKQGIIYYKLLKKIGIQADEVWFIENKIGKNRDKSPQMIKFELKLNEDTIRLYDAMIYEPIRRVIEAVSDPNYVYLINPNDSFVDQAELNEFWARTMMAEVDDFNIPHTKREMIEKRLKKIRDSSLAMISPKIIKQFRNNAAEFIKYDLSNKNMTREQKIEYILNSLGMLAKVEKTFNGYSSDTFLLSLSKGQNITSIKRFKLDIASALSVPNIRMHDDLFVYEGQSYVAIEANKRRDRVLTFDPLLLDGMSIPIGKDNYGNILRWDMLSNSTPHALVSGATGSGKSVCLVSTIEYAKLAGVDNIYIFDPKYEFIGYKGANVLNDIEDIETVMELLVEDMETLVKQGSKRRTLIVFDEFADAVANSRKGKALNIYENVVEGVYKNGRQKIKKIKVGERKSLEDNLRLLLQKSRSVGFNIIAATQRASTKVMTGDLKVNFGLIVAFRVPKSVDSRVIIDEDGAETLAGMGDGLLKSVDYSNILRFQGFLKK